MKIYLFLLFFSMGVSLGEPTKGVFYSLVVGDTLDNQIGQSCIPDVYRIDKSLCFIAQQINMPRQATVLDGENCTEQQILSWIYNLSTTPHDIIFFHYAGHGRKDPGKTSWPQLTLRRGRVSGAKIEESIRNKHVQLAVILFDCCNVWTKQKRADIDHYVPIICDRNLKGLKTLFANTKGFITASATSPGEGATGKTSGHKWGGYFTTGFLLAINKHRTNTRVSWSEILYSTKSYAARKSEGEQHAFYKIKHS
jgi:hypothetical protein